MVNSAMGPRSDGGHQHGPGGCHPAPGDTRNRGRRTFGHDPGHVTTTHVIIFTGYVAYSGPQLKRTNPIKARTVKRPASDRLVRTVASSTAIETGESVATIEARLKARRSRFRHLKLG